MVDGLPKAAGKTTLLLAAVRAQLAKQTFLGRPTKNVRTLLVSEENKNTLDLALARAGLADITDGFYVLRREIWAGIPWPELVGRIDATIRELKIDWLILDTFYAIAGITGEREFSPGAVLEAINPVVDLTGKLNVATTLNRHERKSGGDVGQSGMGSTQLTGSADTIVQLRRVSDLYTSSTRQIEVIGRIEQASLKIELLDGCYEEVNFANTPTAEDERAKLDQIICSDPSISIRDLEKVSGIPRSRVKSVARAAGWIFHGKRGRQKNGSINGWALWTRLDESLAPEWHDEKVNTEYPQ